MPDNHDKVKRLATLRWKETSGVDHPANEEEGWVVMKASIPTHGGTPEETKTWDATAAEKRWRQWASSDGSGDTDKINWDKYAKGFAVKTGDGEKLGDYGYLHHDIVDGKPVVSRAGMIAAGTAASGARTGKPNKDAQTHLGPHYEQFDMTAPWEKVAAMVGDLDEPELEKVLRELIDEEAAGLDKGYGDMPAAPDLIRSMEALANFLQYSGEDTPDALKDTVRATLKELVSYLTAKGVDMNEYLEKHSHTQLAESLNPRVVPKQQVVSFVIKLLKRLVKKARGGDGATDERVALKALAEEWPAFVEKVVGIVRGDGDADTKRTALAKAVEDLRATVTK